MRNCSICDSCGQRADLERKSGKTGWWYELCHLCWVHMRSDPGFKADEFVPIPDKQPLAWEPGEDGSLRIRVNGIDIAVVTPVYAVWQATCLSLEYSQTTEGTEEAAKDWCVHELRKTRLLLNQLEI